MTIPAPTPEDMARDPKREYEVLFPATREAVASRLAWIRRTAAAEAELAAGQEVRQALSRHIERLEAEIREWESMCLDSEGFPRGGDYILKWMRSWRERHDALKGAANGLEKRS